MGASDDGRLRTRPDRGPDDALRALVRGIPAVPYRAVDDDDSTTVFIGPQVEAVLGYTVDEWLMPPDLWTEILHPDDRERVLAAWDLASDEDGVFDEEYRMIAADGTVVGVHDRARRTLEDDGTTVWHGVFLDVTAARLRRERSEEEHVFLEGMLELRDERIAEAGALMELEVAERRSLEERLRSAEERLADLKTQTRRSWLYTWNVVDGRATGGFNDPNTATELGADPKDVERGDENYWRGFLHPADADRVFDRIHTATTTGAPFEDSYRWVAPDGRARWMLDRAVPTAWDPVTRSGQYVGLMIDVSDLMGRITPEA